MNAAHAVSLTVACASRGHCSVGALDDGLGRGAAVRGGDDGCGCWSSSSSSSSENVRRCRRPDPRVSPPNPPSPLSFPLPAVPPPGISVRDVVAISSPSKPVSLCHPPRVSAPHPRHSLSPLSSAHSFTKYTGSSTTNSALQMNVSSSGDKPWPSSDSTRNDPNTQITHTAAMKAYPTAGPVIVETLWSKVGGSESMIPRGAAGPSLLMCTVTLTVAPGQFLTSAPRDEETPDKGKSTGRKFRDHSGGRPPPRCPSG